MTKAEAIFRYFFVVDGVFDKDAYTFFCLARRVMIEELTWSELTSRFPAKALPNWNEEDFPKSTLNVYLNDKDDHYDVYDDKPSFVKQSGHNNYSIQWRVHSPKPKWISHKLHRPTLNGPALIYIDLTIADNDFAISTFFYTNGRKLVVPKYWQKDENLSQLMNRGEYLVDFVRKISALPD